MADAVVGVPVSTDESGKKSLKRKRVKPVIEIPTTEECEKRVRGLNEELQSLFRYYREMLSDSVVRESDFDSCSASNLNGMIAVLLEEKSASYSNLVNKVYEKVKGRDDKVAIASVKSSVLYVGQRVAYGVPNADTDVLEDETESSLWCWETREMKFLPNYIRGMVKIRRTCRKKINERIVAILGVISALQRPENHQALVKASNELNKILNEADIRLLVESMTQRTGSDLFEKEAKLGEKHVVKELEKNKLETEKERKRIDRELQKKKLQNEKELKRLQEEAEKDEKWRVKEESEIKRQLKRKQEEAERDQRRREKEEAELKKCRSIQKQASMMEQFVKRKRSSSTPEMDQSPDDVKLSLLSTDNGDIRPDSVTFLMDSGLSQKDGIGMEEIRMSHFNAWRCLGLSVRSRNKQHWGLRRKPKVELVRELKLTTNKCQAVDEDLIIESMVDGWGEANANDRSCNGNVDGTASGHQKRTRCKQLLQFHMSCRPAFYGVCPRKSAVVGPRHPLRKDPDLVYDVDSDLEWEEEDPGESLSDCEKDEEESLDEACMKADEEVESDDGFFVPDGYLSENEGVENDGAESRLGDQAAKTAPSCELEVESEDYSAWIRQQKCLQNLADHALRKNQPLVITNLMHEKSSFLPTEDLVGALKLEQMCLQALAIRAFPGSLSIEVPSDLSFPKEDEETQMLNCKGNVAAASIGTLPDAALPKIASTILSCPHGMNKLLESLQQKFPETPKSHLKNKVREIADFVDNRWQVKKEIADKLGLSISPEKSGERTKSIASFFSKRCMPPAGHGVNPPIQSPPESSQKTPLVRQQQPQNCAAISKHH
ncbi:hypothetical protein Dimus_011859 [Dionaea muscipula]